MIRRILATAAWMFFVGLAMAFGIGGLLRGLGFLGLSISEVAQVAIGLGTMVLVLSGAMYAGVLAYRGRLPLTPRTVERAEPGRRSRIGTLVAMVGAGLFVSSISAIVAAMVSTGYVTEVYDRQREAGEAEWIITVESELLGETRHLRVKLPADYEALPDERYPVLLVLDGGWQLEHTVGTAEVVQRLGLVEPMIIVGVVNGMAGRSVDFVPPGSQSGSTPGRADLFLEFLETEALPALDRDLRTNSTRLIAGHSLGGLFVTYSLIERPDLFDGRFAFSPSWWMRDRHIVSELDSYLEQAPTAPSYLYLSLGALESSGMQGAFEAGTALLREKAPANLVWEAELTTHGDHGDNPIRSTPMALRGFGAFRSRFAAVEEGQGSGN